MVINPAVVPLPVSTANPPTESVRHEARLQERVPETPATTESVRLKPRAEQGAQSARTETPRSETPVDRQVQERADGEGEQQQSNSEQQQEDAQRQSQQEQAERRQELQEIQQLKSTDRAVRAHEAAHAAVGGRYAGAPSYTFKRGPDGRSYAVAGEVPIDTSEIPGNPRATIRKMQQVQRAALAPADPSSQDLKVAAQAAAKANEARRELPKQQRESVTNDASAQTGARLSFKTEQGSEAVLGDRDSMLTPQQRFQQRLRNLGVIDAPQSGDRLSVTA